MHILIAPGAFKHSLTATQAAHSIQRGIQAGLPSATMTLLPIADGGNGTLDAWLANGGTRYTVSVHDPLMRPVEADYGILPDGKTAIIEMALASGIELLITDEHNPLIATTYGTGELMRHALDEGARRFIIGMGGSATVDGGSGAIRALGVKLLDTDGAEIAHGGGNLTELATINTDALDSRWGECEIIIASDVDNPLLGEQGAATVFAPQKGASLDDVQTLESNLAHFAQVIADQHNTDIREVAGTGAAGGLSAGLLVFLGGRIQSGIDLLLDHADFDTLLANIDLIITGEGQMDAQTIHGKGPIGIAQRAQKMGVPTVALVGGLDVHDKVLHDAGIQAVLPIVTKPMSLDDAIADAENLLEWAALRVGYLLSMK